MVNLKLDNESPESIDRRKRVLEAKFYSDLRSLFNIMASDTENLYKSDSFVDAKDIAKNYRAEFLFLIRKIIRKGIKEFGFVGREDLQKKHNLIFDIESKKKLLDLNLKQSIEVIDADLDDKVEDINKEFNKEVTLCIANESEKQADLITETNEKEINKAVSFGLAAFGALMLNKEKERNKLIDQLARSDDNSERLKLERRIRIADNAITDLNKNKSIIVAENLRKKIKDDAVARSELISFQNVGLAEAWSREKEAEIINNAELISSTGKLISTQKKWNATLDSKTRTAHRAADGQIIPIQDNFIVDGESLKFPRDPAGSSKNIINCRCLVTYTIN